MKKIKSIISIVLVLMLAVSCLASAEITSFATEAEATETVYFNNSLGWDTVNCYMWSSQTGKINAKWPGETMTKLENNIWSYEVNSDSSFDMIIFNNGGYGEGNQTDDLVYPGGGIYNAETGRWEIYDTPLTPVIRSDKSSGIQFKDTLDLSIAVELADDSYYTLNGGEAVYFTDKTDITLGSGDEPQTYTINVVAENSYDSTSKTFTFEKVNTTVNPVDDTQVPEFAEANSIYAHAEAESQSSQAWQKWEQQSGVNAESGIYYIFLPKTADSSRVELYNTFGSSVIIDGTEIEPKTSAIISYTQGETVTVSVEGYSSIYKMQIYKSDADASVYINDTTGVYTGNDGMTVNTDFYSFLIADKENSVSGSYCTIIDDNGTNDTTLKKIKGRGNTTWNSSNKKPFNLTFDSKTNIAGITSKKFSLLSNSKDGSLLRNKVMYDLADEVGSEYAPDSRYLDLYINGIYRGSFLITQKVDLGKNSLVTLTDESDKLTENFSFIVEVDIWNYAGDVNFVSDRGIHVVCKAPDLDGYDGVDETLNAQYAYISGKYQQLEDALYSGTMEELEQICDVESLAKGYLLQEFAKNCDGGMTSCYFTYNATTGKFYSAPAWDFDSGLGNVTCVRQNASNTAYVEGWTTRTAQYDKTRMTNIMGQAFALEGTTSEGKTFEDVVKDVWNEKFVPAIAVLKGEQTAQGSRLKSVEEYSSSTNSLSYINFIMWDHEWYPYYETLSGNYSYDRDGQVSYMTDWLEARESWLNNVLNSEIVIPEADYYITGIGFGGWGATDYKLEKDDKGYYSAHVTFVKDTEYSFKIFDNNGKYFTADLNDEETAKYFTYSDAAYQNAYIVPEEDISGTITFTGNSFIFIPDVEETTAPETEPETTEPPIQKILGDVDSDGSVTIKDAAMIQLYLAKLYSGSFDESVADVLNDGVINIKDAAQIQLQLAKLL